MEKYKYSYGEHRPENDKNTIFEIRYISLKYFRVFEILRFQYF